MLITISSVRFSEFDAGNVISFQTKVFGRNIKETTLVRYFIEVTARSSFTRLSVIKQINRVHIKYENREYVTKIQLYLLLI